ncbi:MAG: hypothetical protein HQL31_11320, partial [Planctomycetes bacterium]|nr:hypothetical protein [Planctomycetota bacterium]
MKNLNAIRILALSLGLTLYLVGAWADLRFHGGSLRNMQSTIPLKIDTNGDGTEDVIMEVDGDMGISTTTAAAKLHIAGNLRVDNWLIMTSQVSAPPTVPGNGL